MNIFTSIHMKSETKKDIISPEWEIRSSKDKSNKWSLISTNFNSNQVCSRLMSRARMFSPSSWVTNVGEFRKQVMLSRNDKISKPSGYEDTKESEIKEIANKVDDPLHCLDTMKKIYIGLFNKTSKLVKITKQSRFLGFFSTRRLRNKIKSGNLSQIPWSEIRIKRRVFSPCKQHQYLDNTDSTANQQIDHRREKSKWTNVEYAGSSRKYFYSRRTKLKLRSEKYKKLQLDLTINDDKSFYSKELKINSCTKYHESSEIFGCLL